MQEELQIDLDSQEPNDTVALTEESTTPDYDLLNYDIQVTILNRFEFFILFYIFSIIIIIFLLFRLRRK